jgi:hypothetical protein
VSLQLAVPGVMCTVKQPSIYCCCGKLTTNNYLYPGTKPRKAKVSTRVSSLKKGEKRRKVKIKI